MAKPTGAVDLGPMKARLATLRAAQARTSTRSDQDIRLDLYEYNHRAAEGPAGGDTAASPSA